MAACWTCCRLGLSRLPSVGGRLLSSKVQLLSGQAAVVNYPCNAPLPEQSLSTAKRLRRAHKWVSQASSVRAFHVLAGAL